MEKAQRAKRCAMRLAFRLSDYRARARAFSELRADALKLFHAVYLFPVSAK